MEIATVAVVPHGNYKNPSRVRGEGGKNPSLGTTVCHLLACDRDHRFSSPLVMTNGDPEGLIFLSHLHTNNGLFFLLTIKFKKGSQKFLRHDMMMSF